MVHSYDSSTWEVEEKKLPQVWGSPDCTVTWGLAAYRVRPFSKAKRKKINTNYVTLYFNKKCLIQDCESWVTELEPETGGVGQERRGGSNSQNQKKSNQINVFMFSLHGCSSCSDVNLEYLELSESTPFFLTLFSFFIIKHYNIFLCLSGNLLLTLYSQTEFISMHWYLVSL